jgi:hypothetical protein
MRSALSQCLYDTGYLKAIPLENEIATKAANPENTSKNRAAWDGEGQQISLYPIRKDTGVIAGF